MNQYWKFVLVAALQSGTGGLFDLFNTGTTMIAKFQYEYLIW